MVLVAAAPEGINTMDHTALIRAPLQSLLAQEEQEEQEEVLQQAIKVQMEPPRHSVPSLLRAVVVVGTMARRV
jgi:hypothetical protein